MLSARDANLRFLSYFYGVYSFHQSFSTSQCFWEHKTGVFLIYFADKFEVFYFSLTFDTAGGHSAVICIGNCKLLSKYVKYKV